MICVFEGRLTPDIFKNNFYIHVSCEFDTFRVDTHLCKLRDTSSFATKTEELN